MLVVACVSQADVQEQPKKVPHMTKSDLGANIAADVTTALQLLSRLPVTGPSTHATGRSAWAYPVAGLVVGSCAGLAVHVALWVGLPSALSAIVGLAALVVLTGAMHEDGLADTVDGLWGGWDRTRRLEIMKDSRIGAYGVIALVLSLLARWGAIWMLIDTGQGFAALIVAGCVSRAVMPPLMWGLPHARDTGLSHSVGGVDRQMALFALAIATLVALIGFGTAGFSAMIWAVLGAFGLGLIARAKIGGQTGDILGAAQQVAEIAVLFALIA